jgi:hypothetical protein
MSETPSKSREGPLRRWIVRADEEGHRLAAGDAFLFLFGWRDAVPAQLFVELRARDTWRMPRLWSS